MEKGVVLFVKDKLVGALGGLGLVLWYLIGLVLLCMPLYFLKLPFWATALIILAIIYLRGIGEILTFVVWIWAFLSVLKMPLNGASIVFYVTFAIFCFTSILPVIVNLVISIVQAFKE